MCPSVDDRGTELNGLVNLRAFGVPAGTPTSTSVRVATGAIGSDQFDRELQQVRVEQDFVAVDVADGVAVELAALRVNIN